MSNTDWKNAEFRFHFGVNDKFQDRLVTMATGNYSLDVSKFEEWLVRQGYDENQGSMNDYVEQEYGPKAQNFIEELLI